MVADRAVLVPAQGSLDVTFLVAEDFVPRRLTAKLPPNRRDLLVTGAKHVVQGRVVITVCNRSTFARAMRLGLSDEYE